MSAEGQHSQLLRSILETGDWVTHYREGRPPIRLLQVFAPNCFRYDLATHIPLITERHVPWKNSIKELLWMLSGSVDNTVLLDQKCPVWRMWDLRPADISANRAERGADVDLRGNPVYVGSCGPIYGAMWRAWPDWAGRPIDQIQYVIDTLRERPASRRIIVSGWNPDVLPDENLGVQENILAGRQALAPCHTLFQFSTTSLTAQARVQYASAWSYQPQTVDRDVLDAYLNKMSHVLGRLDRDFDLVYPKDAARIHAECDAMGIPRHRLNLRMVARSQDLPLGTVFNQFAYAVLLRMMAAQVNMFAGVYVHTMNDTHIYENQIEGVQEQIQRSPREFPKLHLNPKVSSLFDYTLSDFTLLDYNPHPAIVFELTK